MDGNAHGAGSVSVSATALLIDALRQVPLRALALLRMTSLTNISGHVILSGGGAGGRDLTSAGSFDAMDGNARGASSVLNLGDCIAG